MLFEDGSLPWHRVHAVSPEGPVGKNGIVQPGDHLVEVIKTLPKLLNHHVHIRCRVSAFIASPSCMQRVAT